MGPFGRKSTPKEPLNPATRVPLVIKAIRARPSPEATWWPELAPLNKLERNVARNPPLEGDTNGTKESASVETAPKQGDVAEIQGE